MVEQLNLNTKTLEEIITPCSLHTFLILFRCALGPE